MYPISINLRAESDLRASMCAHACLSIKETLCDRGEGVRGWGQLVEQPQTTLLTSSRLFMRFLAFGCTQYLTDL